MASAFKAMTAATTATSSENAMRGPALASRDRAIVDAMGFDPVDFDTILDRTGLDTATAQARLLDLELEGHIQRMAGGRFQRRARG